MGNPSRLQRGFSSPALFHTHLSLGEMLGGLDTSTQTDERLRQNVKYGEIEANILCALFRILSTTQQEDEYKKEEDIHL